MRSSVENAILNCKTSCEMPPFPPIEFVSLSSITSLRNVFTQALVQGLELGIVKKNSLRVLSSNSKFNANKSNGKSGK